MLFVTHAASTAVLDKFRVDRISMELTGNVGYGVGPGRCVEPEEIYDEIAIGSRRNGVYGGDVYELEPYSIYDVVL